jgi:hypothetical protein
VRPSCPQSQETEHPHLDYSGYLREECLLFSFKKAGAVLQADQGWKPQKQRRQHLAERGCRGMGLAATSKLAPAMPPVPLPGWEPAVGFLEMAASAVSTSKLPKGLT